MHYLEIEVALERVEVAVAVKQGVAVPKTKACDEAVNYLADGMAAPPEETIVLPGCYRKFLSACAKDGEHRELAANPFECGFVADALQDFAKDEIGQTERPLPELAVEPAGVRIHCSAEVVDPDSSVDDGHAVQLILRATEAGLLQVALPPYLAAKATDTGLGMDLHEKAQTSLDGGPLGMRATASHCLMDKLIVDFDVRPQEFLYV
jgi:hypothetical protein